MIALAHKKVITEKCLSMNIFIDPFNKRVRVDDVLGDVEKGIHQAEKMAEEVGAEKLIIKGRREQFLLLLELGYQCEACIDGYFLGSNNYLFCKYFTSERRNSEQWTKEDEIVEKVQKLHQDVGDLVPPKEYKLKRIEKEDTQRLAELYKAVFEIYPTPLHEPEYIKKTIDEGTIYYAFQSDEKLVSAASAEVNAFYKNAELTDCATLPEYRKHGLMKVLLRKLEEQLKSQGVFCAYSIARALSFGMNGALHQLKFEYRGRLINNCYIYNKLENMNVWVKDLSFN